MVCFVHDRKFLSKFHGLINQLRKTNEFTTLTLRQLPKQCCACTQNGKTIASGEAESVLTSLNIEALRFVCLQLDLKRCITNYTLSSSSENHIYTVLYFPILLQAKVQTAITDQFLTRYSNEIKSLEQNHQVRFEFVSSSTSKDLLNQVSQWKYDLVTKCSNYLAARQAINGVWVIISAEVQSSIDVVKDALQKHWYIFITNFDINMLAMMNNSEWNYRPIMQTNKQSSRYTHANKHQWMLKNRRSKPQTGQIKHKFQQSVMGILPASDKSSENLDDEYDDVVDDLVEDVLTRNHTRLEFLFQRFQNSNKCRRPRTHRRQHIMALAMCA